MTTQRPEGSRWQGKTPQERRFARRKLLVDASLDLVAAGGPAALGVRAICREANLTERYFYESFGSLNELIGELYETVQEGAYQALQTAMMRSEPGFPAAEATITAYVDYLSADPRRARIFLMEAEMAGAITPQLRRKVERNRGLFVSLLRGVSDDPGDLTGLELNATALMGSQTRLFLSWTSGGLNVTRERFIRHAFEIFKAVSAVRS